MGPMTRTGVLTSVSQWRGRNTHTKKICPISRMDVEVERVTEMAKSVSV
jgi:hypothetical protein